MASYQYVYVMKDLTKAFPGGREVFKGITLSFLPGVKIGVLGVNGAGKSTLMKIMAGLDTEFGGEAWAAPGARPASQWPRDTLHRGALGRCGAAEAGARRIPPRGWRRGQRLALAGVPRRPGRVGRPGVGRTDHPSGPTGPACR